MIRLPPKSTRTYTLVPNTPLLRYHDDAHAVGCATYREAGPDRDHPVAGRVDHERPPGIPCCVEERFAARQVDAALAARKGDDDAAVAAEGGLGAVGQRRGLQRADRGAVGDLMYRERKSVVEGKSVYARVDLGGSRLSQKKNKNKTGKTQ